MGLGHASSGQAFDRLLWTQACAAPRWVSRRKTGMRQKHSGICS
jgi:hypothetical protein